MGLIDVKTMARSDFPFATRLTNTMNWDLTEEDFRFMMAMEPEGCFVALDDTKKTGLITTVSFDKIGWIGNVIVDTRYRSKGAGLQLVKHAMNYLVRKGVTVIGLYSYLDTVPFYKKLGFKSDCNFVRLAGHGSDGHVNVKSVESMNADDLKVVVDLDKRCAGWNRERLLKRIFKGSSDLCYVVHEGSGLLGFVMADWYRQEVGPLVCRPSHDEEALGLLKVVLSKLANVDVRIGVLEAKQEIIDALLDVNFREEFRVTRMYWGDKPEDTGCLLAMESLERG